MKQNVGRPKRTDVTKRIQCVIPEEVLNKLDDKIKSQQDSKNDRSKAITEAVKNWLGFSNTKRNFENIYAKLGEPFSKENLNNLDDFAELIIEKLISDDTDESKLTKEEIDKINDLLSKLKISTNYNLEVESNIKEAFILEKILFLNKLYPIKNYLGKCPKCGTIFFKKRYDQKFDTKACNILIFDKELSEKSSDLKKHIDIKKAVEDLKLKIDSDSIIINDYINKKNNNKSYIITMKNILNDICLECDYSFSKLKKFFKKVKDVNSELYNFILNFHIEYEEYLINSFSIEEKENMTRDSWAKITAKEFFPITNNIRYHFENWLKLVVTPLFFKLRKDMIIAKDKIRNSYLGSPEYFKAKHDFNIAIEEFIKYYENNDELGVFEKFVNIVRSKQLLIRENIFNNDFDIDKAVQDCNEILEAYPNDIDARSLIIIINFKKFLLQPSDEIIQEIISQYEKIQDTNFKRMVYKNNQTRKDVFEGWEDLYLSIPFFEDLVKLVEVISFVAYLLNKDSNKDFNKFENLAKNITSDLETQKDKIITDINNLKRSANPGFICYLKRNLHQIYEKKYIIIKVICSILINILKSISEQNLEKTIETTKDTVLFFEKCLDSIIELLDQLITVLEGIKNNPKELENYPNLSNDIATFEMAKLKICSAKSYIKVYDNIAEQTLFEQCFEDIFKILNILFYI